MFTNQKDINDNEICEGDIVEFNPIGSTDVKVVINRKPCSGCGSTMWHYKGQKFPLKQNICRKCVENKPFQISVKPI